MFDGDFCLHCTVDLLLMDDASELWGTSGAGPALGQAHPPPQFLETRQSAPSEALPSLGRRVYSRSLMDLPMRSLKSVSLRFVAASYAALLSIVAGAPTSVPSADNPLAAAIESARKTRDEKQLQSVKAQLDQRIAQYPGDAGLYLELARVQGYLADVYEMRRDKKATAAAVDKAIDAAQRSNRLNDQSADAHSLLADLYGRKIGLGNGMFAGPKFGPKVKEENAKAFALDDKNPQVWASLGRQCLMAPKMFGGDVAKASY